MADGIVSKASTHFYGTDLIKIPLSLSHLVVRRLAYFEFPRTGTPTYSDLQAEALAVLFNFFIFFSCELLSLYSQHIASNYFRLFSKKSNPPSKVKNSPLLSLLKGKHLRSEAISQEELVNCFELAQQN